MPFTTNKAAKLLKHWLANQACSNVGDAAGLQPSAAANSMYVSLHTASPGASGTQATSETTYTGYLRRAVARGLAAWTVVGNYLQNSATISFPAVGSGSGTITHVGVGFALSGAGELDAFDALATPKAFTPGDVIEFAPGELKIKLLDA